MCIRAPRPLIRLESASFSFGSLTRVVRSFVLEEDAPKRTLISGIVTELPRIKKWQSDRGRENEKEKEREGSVSHCYRSRKSMYRGGKGETARQFFRDHATRSLMCINDMAGNNFTVLLLTRRCNRDYSFLCARN